MFSFHLTTGDDGETCTNWLRHLQMKETGRQHGPITEVKIDSHKSSTSHTFLIEYEFDTNGNGDVFLAM